MRRYHFAQSGRHPWQVAEEAFNTWAALFRVEGAAIYVIDDDKIHAESPSLHLVDLYIATLGELKRKGPTMHGGNSSYFRFKLCTKTQRKGETVADCLRVILLLLGGAATEGQLKEGMKLLHKLLLFDRAYTHLQNLILIVAAGGDVLGTFRKTFFSPFLVDRRPSSTADGRHQIASKGCKTMVTAICKRPELVATISSPLLKDRLCIIAFANGRGTVTLMWHTMPHLLNGVYAMEEDHTTRRIPDFDPTTPGFFLQKEGINMEGDTTALCVRLLSAVMEVAVPLTREQGPSPMWMPCRTNALTGKSAAHAIRAQAKLDAPTALATQVYVALNGGDGVPEQKQEQE